MRRHAGPVKPIGGLLRRGPAAALAHGDQSPQMRRNLSSRGNNDETLGFSDHTAAIPRSFCSTPSRDPTGIFASAFSLRCPPAAHALSFKGLISPPLHAAPACLSTPRALRRPAIPHNPNRSHRRRARYRLLCFKASHAASPPEKSAPRSQSYKDPMAERQPGRYADVHRPSSTSHGQPRAARNLIAVVIRILVCPASIF